MQALSAPLLNAHSDLNSNDDENNQLSSPPKALASPKHALKLQVENLSPMKPTEELKVVSPAANRLNSTTEFEMKPTEEPKIVNSTTEFTQAQEDQATKQRQKRPRILVDMHNQNKQDQDQKEDEGEQVNEYERARMERIQRNQEVMRQMGLHQLAVETMAVARGLPATGGDGGDQSTAAPKPPRKRSAGKKNVAPAGPRRTSARNTSSNLPLLSSLDGQQASAARDSIDADDHLMELEDYFKAEGIDYSQAIQVDGHYRGWIPSAVAEKYGLPLEHPGDEWLRAAAAASSGRSAAASSGGSGGKRGRKKGGSDAKAKALASLSYNPNAYFYRHVAPHEQQAQGEWTQEEHEKFIQVVRQWGVGDNWGLFASHIPQRVGYQCSAFYRDVIIPSGLVLDPRFKMQPNGKAIFTR